MDAHLRPLSNIGKVNNLPTEEAKVKKSAFHKLPSAEATKQKLTSGVKTADYLASSLLREVAKVGILATSPLWIPVAACQLGKVMFGNKPKEKDEKNLNIASLGTMGIQAYFSQRARDKKFESI